MDTKRLLIKLGKKFPAKLCEPWDHSLYQLGNLKKEVNTILLCLDFDEIVFEYMENNDLFSKVDLIITHHPFIFGKKSVVLKNELKKKELYDKLLAKNVLIYSYHTNFDSGEEGMNFALANKLELTNVTNLSNCTMARKGYLKKPLEVHQFAKYAKEKLNVNYGLLLPYGKKMISSVALIGGGGSGYYKYALEDNVDIYISGDCPHHIRRDIINSKYNYLDLPHEIEKIFMPQMKSVLLSIDDKLNIIIFDHEKEPEVI